MVPVAIRPRPVVPAPPIRAMPELTVSRYSEPPTFSRPIGLLKLARASWAMVVFWPLEWTLVMVPSWAKVNDCSVLRAVPSCDMSQDGTALGTLQSFTFAQAGTITSVHSNGQNTTIAQLALANFNNPMGLEKVGGSEYRETVNSGIALIGGAGTTGRGLIATGTIEMSNVDLAQEFTNLIIAQRGFQANSKVISASDEILQDLVNMKR